MGKSVRAGGRSAATPQYLGLAALAPPGERLLRQVLFDSRRPYRFQEYPLQTSRKRKRQATRALIEFSRGAFPHSITLHRTSSTTTDLGGSVTESLPPS